MAHLWDQDVHGFQLNVFLVEYSEEEAGSRQKAAWKGRRARAAEALGTRREAPATAPGEE